MKEFPSRYPGICRKCHGTINVGDTILWEPGNAQHKECPEVISGAPGNISATSAVTQSRPGYTMATFGVPEAMEMGRWGSYLAIKDDSGDDGHTFFRVRKTKDGNWKGWYSIWWIYGEVERRIARQRAGSDKLEFLPDIAVPGQSYEYRFGDKLYLALDNWVEAMKLYGQKIGRCGHCGLRLTDEVSRAYGIGPICRRDHKL